MSKPSTTKKSFLLYKDFYYTLKKLSDEQAGKFIKAIFEWQINGEHSPLEFAVDLVMTPVIEQFKRDDESYKKICKRNQENGKSGGRPKKPKKPSGLSGNPKKPKKPDTDNDSDTDSGNDSDIDNEKKPSTNGASSDDATEAWISHKKRKLTGKRLEAFKQVWNAFGYKKGRAGAIDAFLDIPELTDSMVSEICAAAKIECNERPALIAKGSTPIFLQGWISWRRWEDEIVQQVPQQTKTTAEDLV